MRLNTGEEKKLQGATLAAFVSKGFVLLAYPFVVLLAVDVFVLAILGGLDILLFVGADVSIGGRICLLAVDPCLSALEVGGLTVGQ